jgi:hypothetical protein
MEMAKAINATTKTICAAAIAVPAMPPNPSAAARMATIRNVTAHPNIFHTPLVNYDVRKTLNEPISSLFF